MSKQDAGIRCIIGLGNPGSKYELTRHNAGFWFVDELARQRGVSLRSEVKFFSDVCRVQYSDMDYWLVKPTTFMNRSGQSVSAICRFYKIEPNQLLVVHDELDMSPGTTRLKFGGGHGGHNGLRDITAALNTADFYRLRVGIGHPGHRDQVVDYVLSRPNQADAEQIQASLVNATEIITHCLRGDYQGAMNQLHSL